MYVGQFCVALLHCISFAGSAFWFQLPYFSSLVIALMPCQLDQGNSILSSTLASLIRHLQSILNAAARLIFYLRRSDQITDALVDFRGLQMLEIMKFRIAIPDTQSHNSSAGTCCRRTNSQRWSVSSHCLTVNTTIRLSSISCRPFQLLTYLLGTIYHPTSLPRCS